jgi:hypothetical protein
MSEKELEFQIHKTDDKEKWLKLFLLFLQGIPALYFEQPTKVIPYCIARLSLINRRVTLNDAKKIISKFCDFGFLAHVPRRGYRVNWERLSFNSEFITIAKNAGINFVFNADFHFVAAKKEIKR